MYGNPDATYAAQSYPDAYSTNQVCLLICLFALVFLNCNIFLPGLINYSLLNHTNENTIPELISYLCCSISKHSHLFFGWLMVNSLSLLFFFFM